MKTTTALALAGAVALLGACADANQNAAPRGDASAPTQGVKCEYPTSGQPAKPVDPPPTSGIPDKGETTATIHMAAGDVELTLDRSLAPCAVNSFTSLVEQGFYNQTRCHRLTDQGIFVLQCGDPTGTGTGGPGYVMQEELDPSLKYPTGTVAMARTQQPTSTGSQFFLVWADTDLPPDYVVIGKMDQAGTDVVAGIAAQGVDAGDGTSPIADASIKDITLG